MKQQVGFFSLQTPKDLLAKLEVDYERLRVVEATSIDSQYAAFDFFVTAWHMADWVARSTGRTLGTCRTYADASMVDDLANGAKHFRVDPNRHATVSATGSAGAFDPAIFDSAVFAVARLVVDLADGTTVNVLDLAKRVLDHWRQAV